MIGISKEQQLKHNKKPKEKTFGKKKYSIKKRSVKNALTIEEKKYLEYLNSIRNEVKCFACGENNPNDSIEWHHVKNRSSDKKNHLRLIPLCGREHHRNGDISPHGNAKKWREIFDYSTQLIYAAGIHLRYINEKR